MSLTVTCRCVGCHHIEDFDPAPTDTPMCPKCFAPMVAIAAARLPNGRTVEEQKEAERVFYEWFQSVGFDLMQGKS